MRPICAICTKKCSRMGQKNPIISSSYLRAYRRWGRDFPPSSYNVEALVCNGDSGCQARRHCVAFAKTPKRIRNGGLSVYFKLDSNFQVLKNYRFSIPAQCHICAEDTNGLESNPGPRRNFQPPWPISQTLRWKNAIFTCIWNHSVLQNGELSFSNGWNSIALYFFSQNPKCWFILLQYTNVYLCAKFGDLKPTIDENQRPQIWTLFPSKVKKQHSARKLRFSFDQMFHKS